MPHVVFAWEIGSGFGHLTPIAALGGAFRSRKHRATAVVPEVGRGRQLLTPMGVEVVGSPSNPAPERSFPVSINYTANLLRNGFWHSPTLARRIETWRRLLSRLNPDLLICDHAPAALLASRDAGYARAAIGTGFTLPPLSTPMPSVQPWFPIPPERLTETDQGFLDTVNPVLRQFGLAPLETVASLFDGVERFLCVESELDHYAVRAGEKYWGVIEPESSQPLPEFPSASEPGVFVYLSAANRFVEPVLNTLKARGIPVFAYTPAGLAGDSGDPVQAPNIRYLRTLVDLKQAAARCRLAITHGGTLSASMLLKQGVRLLCCPQDLEKAVLAKRIVERKLAYSFNWFAQNVPSDSRIDELLSSSSLPDNLPAFVEKHAQSAGTVVTGLLDRCESLMSLH